ncbi:MAG: hypothetical protein FWD97_10800, partial [Defluviitaleaceae bacterium]|nr:hypothetical protein [Defluviitaleaceae bacterium]
ITNHGQTFVTFKIMVVDIWGNETILEDGFGDPALYTMPPQSSLVTGHYNIFFSVLLIDEEGEQHQPITLRR